MKSRQATERSAAIRKGRSNHMDANEAIAEFVDRIFQNNMSVVVFFCSPSYDLDEIQMAFNKHLASVTVIGCTTAGEISDEGYCENSISGFSLADPEFEVAVAPISNLREFEIEPGAEVVRQALDRLNASNTETSLSTKLIFAMLLIDGNSKREEAVLASINGILQQIPLFGGSAGDGLNFGPTKIFHNGEFHEDSAVVLLVRSCFAFKVFKFDHFQPTQKKMVVTKADPKRRLVSEINAEIAAPEYARMVGLDEHQLSPQVFASHPVVVRVGGEHHVRSIQKVEDDDSLRFFCAIDEGIVLTVAEGQEMVRNLEAGLQGLEKELGPLQLVLGFDCILRRLESQQTQKLAAISQTLKKYQVIGFSTYGEQYRSMHVNHTFTGVAIAASCSDDARQPK